MCVILVALNRNTQYPFVLAANRDEFYARPTSPADFWNDYPEILAGRDLEANGTWLGVSKSGQFAAITNHHDPFSRDASLCSRGELVSGFLRNQQTLEQYSDILKEGQENYNGYSILFGDRSHLRYQTNKGAMQTDIVSGVHGLSNEFLNSPWSRVEEGKKRLSDAVSIDSDFNTEILFKILSDDSELSESESEIAAKSADPAQLPIFVRLRDYGTRSSTVVLMDEGGNVTFEERTYSPASEHHIGLRRFTLPPNRTSR